MKGMRIVSMKMEYDGLWACHLVDEQASRTCGYRYIVTSHATAHTAFATRRGLDTWLGERGLILEQPIGRKSESSRIRGKYCTLMHMDPDALTQLDGFWTRTLSNGDYVDAVVTFGDDGTRTVHTLNPNVRSRRTYDHQIMRPLYCGDPIAEAV